MASVSVRSRHPLHVGGHCDKTGNKFDVGNVTAWGLEVMESWLNDRTYGAGQLLYFFYSCLFRYVE